MSDKDDENPGHLGVQGWELAKLIGNYERFTQDVDSKLTRIEERLEKGQDTFVEIKTTMAAKAEQLDSHIEEEGLSKRRRWQLDGTTATSIILSFKMILEAIRGIL